jgi:hypothetical protein
MSYTKYLIHSLRKHGIKRALSVAWSMEQYGIIRVRMFALGAVVTLVGIYLGRSHGIELGYLLAMAGAFIAGYNDGRHCVCVTCDCDDPRHVFDTHKYSTEIHEEIEKFTAMPDGTIETPHDRLYRP